MNKTTTQEPDMADIINNFKQRPHIVILDAGASLAALPHGDRNGRKLPVMDNFMETLGL